LLRFDDKEFGFRTQHVWFSNSLFDVEGFDRVYFNGIREPKPNNGFERIDYATIIIDLNAGLDAVWNNMSPKCRKAIRKSENYGLDICLNKDYEQFFQSYTSFVSSKGILCLVKDVEFLKKNGFLFSAESEGNFMGGIFFLADETHMRGYVSCTRNLSDDRECVSFSTKNYALPGIIETTRLLWWNAIKFAKERGIDSLDMGGFYIGSKPNKELEDVNEFKRRFGGKVVNEYTYVRDYSMKLKVAKIGRRGLLKVKELVKKDQKSRV
jgi:hypothetical protein